MTKEPVTPRCCAVIPAYREGRHIAAVVEGVLRQGVDAVVVDDGSDDDTADVAETAGAIVLRQPVNQGKGAALSRGFSYAADAGYDAVITLDADGQHAPEDIPTFVRTFAETRVPVLAGNRMAATDDMPLVRRTTNRFMSWLLSREMGQRVPDTQCGYRLYAAEVLPHLHTEATGFAAESEQLLLLADQGFRIDSVPVRTIYGEEESKINPLPDTRRFFAMLRRHRRAKKRFHH